MPFLRRFSDYAYLLLRVVAGLLFVCHGVQKVFGVLGGREFPVGSLLWIAGVIETIGGSAIALGLFTGPVAFLASGEMAVAYFITHAPRGFWPVMNAGEVTVLYCFLFLYVSTKGPGRFGLTRL